MLITLMEKSGCNNCFFNQSWILTTSSIEHSFKCLLNEYIYLFMNLKFLYIKFSLESNYNKLANYHLDLFRVHYFDHMQKIEHASSLRFSFFNVFKTNKQLDQKKISLSENDKEYFHKIEIANNFISFFINSKAKMLKFLFKLK